MDSFEEKFPWNFMPYHQGYPMPGAMMPVESPMVPWMGMAGGYPVYPANMYPQAYLDEMQNERDMKKMKELYPEVAKDVLSVVEDECDQMEYDGSMMFDEYPDKVMFERIKNRIYDKVQELFCNFPAFFFHAIFSSPLNSTLDSTFHSLLNSMFFY